MINTYTAINFLSLLLMNLFVFVTVYDLAIPCLAAVFCLCSKFSKGRQLKVAKGFVASEFQPQKFKAPGHQEKNSCS